MATRKSGNAVVRVKYNDRGDYSASVAVDGHNVWSGTIGPPAAGFGEGIAYNSPEAYDDIARSALSFAEDDVEDVDIAYETEMVENYDRIRVQRV